MNGDHALYEVSRQYLGEPRPIKIIVIGAGLSGIAAVKLFREQFAGKPTQLVVYEKNSDVGGTWFENRYPGCSCDVPAHAYTFSWEGNPRWSKSYVGSEELFDYFKGRAKAYGMWEFLRLQHQVVGAKWDNEAGQWEVEVEDILGGCRFTDRAEILLNATGFLNKWRWPDIDGLKDFRGHVTHSARWDDSYLFDNKSIMVVGSGSSAIQIVPKLQPVVKHLISINRSATWITPEFALEFAPDGRDHSVFTEDQKEKWVKDADSFLKYRKEIEGTMNRFFDTLYKNSHLQAAAVEQYTQMMKNRLNGREELTTKLIPQFAVGCRRFTPGSGYLEALASDNVTVSRSQILNVTEDSVHLQDGTSYHVDAIVCATGFDTTFRPSFPVIGLHGKDLRDEWQDEPRSYLSVAASGYPNYFLASGPNFPLANGCLIPCLEMCVTYAFRAASKIQTEGIKYLCPQPEAVDDFQDHKDVLMKDLVWTSDCRSWYKNGRVDGKVWGPWPGSSLQFLELMSAPRWEDFKIVYWSGNRFQYLGSGKTEREVKGGDLAYYIVEPPHY